MNVATAGAASRATAEMADYVPLIQAATVEVFATMLGMETIPGEVYEEVATPNPAEGVVALIGLAGAWAGTGALHCSADLACRISSSMLMGEYSAIDGEVLDAVAEIANMIIGNLKTGIEQRVGPMGMSIPTVVFGKNFAARSLGNEHWIVTPFTCEGERLEVKLCLADHRSEPGPRRGFQQAFFS